MPATPGSHISLLRSIASLAATSDAWISDIWGVFHDGVRPYPAASAACVAFRAGGGTVVLVSNAPNPGSEVMLHLDSMGVPRSAYDAIVTSGDVTRVLISAWAGRPVHHLGPDRYLGTFEGLDVQFAPLSEAAVVVCTGLIEDEQETPDDYRALLAELRDRSIPMICVNPDIVVERGPPADLLRGRACRGLCRAGRRGRLRRQALSADLRARPRADRRSPRRRRRYGPYPRDRRRHQDRHRGRCGRRIARRFHRQRASCRGRQRLRRDQLDAPLCRPPGPARRRHDRSGLVKITGKSSCASNLLHLRNRLTSGVKSPICAVSSRERAKRSAASHP